MTTLALEPTPRKMTSPFAIRTFMFAGNSRFTIRSLVTQTRFTFRIKQSERNPAQYFLQVLTGPDNEGDYRYAALLELESDQIRWRFTRNSQYAATDPPMRAFHYLLSHINAKHMPPKLEFWHEGRCGRCGRTLTVPESIASGFGPECITHLHELLNLKLEV